MRLGLALGETVETTRQTDVILEEETFQTAGNQEGMLGEDYDYNADEQFMPIVLVASDKMKNSIE